MGSMSNLSRDNADVYRRSASISHGGVIIEPKPGLSVYWPRSFNCAVLVDWLRLPPSQVMTFTFCVTNSIGYFEIVTVQCCELVPVEMLQHEVSVTLLCC